MTTPDTLEAIRMALTEDLNLYANPRDIRDEWAGIINARVLPVIDDAVAEALETARDAGIGVLANYEHAIGNNGNRAPIQYVMDKLTAAIRALKPKG